MLPELVGWGGGVINSFFSPFLYMYVIKENICCAKRHPLQSCHVIEIWHLSQGYKALYNEHICKDQEDLKTHIKVNTVQKKNNFYRLHKFCCFFFIKLRMQVITLIITIIYFSCRSVAPGMRKIWWIAGHSSDFFLEREL